MAVFGGGGNWASFPITSKKKCRNGDGEGCELEHLKQNIPQRALYKIC